MTRVVTLFIAFALVVAFYLGVIYGFDPAAIAMFFALVVVGALAIAVSRGKDRGMTAPAQCTSCGGLISPNAPYCKHCGEPVER